MNKKVVVMFSLMLTFALSAYAENKDNNSTNSPKTEKNMEVTHLTQAEFIKKVYDYKTNPNEWKFEGKRPAIIDFYATWCGPCKAMAPVLEDISREFNGKIDVYKIDVDKEQELAAAFGIRSIPTLLLIPMDKEPQISQGALPKEQLKKIINDFLLDKK